MPSFIQTSLIFLFVFLFVSLGIFLYFKSNYLTIHSKLGQTSRKIIIVTIIFLCFYIAFMPFYPGAGPFWTFKGFLVVGVHHLIRSIVLVFLPVCIIVPLQNRLDDKHVPVRKQHIIVILSIFILLTGVNLFLHITNLEARWGTVAISHVFILLYICGMVSMLYLIASFSRLAQKRIEFEKELEISKLSQLKTKAELEVLESRINPHFLYNSLNSIAELSVLQGAKARKMTIALAGLFRYSLNKKDETEITVADEVKMVESFLFIEKIRFEDKLEMQFEIEKDTESITIPKFILQPLVENAITHGFENFTTKGFIKLKIKSIRKGIEIIIHDNGRPFPEDLQLGYGLKSVIDRLKISYPNRHNIHFENTPTKQITITLHAKFNQ